MTYEVRFDEFLWLVHSVCDAESAKNAAARAMYPNMVEEVLPKMQAIEVTEYGVTGNVLSLICHQRKDS